MEAFMHHLYTKTEKNWPASGKQVEINCLTGGLKKIGFLTGGQNKRRNTNEKNTRMRR